MPNVWQVAAGDQSRFYAGLFRKHDLMFIGPGHFGPYDRRHYDDVVEKNPWMKEAAATVRRFVEKPKADDIVLLRSGNELSAIGVIPHDGGYEWRSEFEDVHGWDLQHTRRVAWQSELPHDLLDTLDGRDNFFGSLRQMRKFSAINDAARLNRLKDHFGEFANAAERSLKTLPLPPPSPLTNEQLGEALYDKGLAHEVVTRLLDAIEQIRRIGRWYHDSAASGERPSEHEIIAYMVLPLLMALGWSQQLVSVEWKKIDLAAFDFTPTVPENCALICEAKLLQIGLAPALGQALGYVDRHNLNRCRTILLSDGLIYYLYGRQGVNERGDVDWSSTPNGYLNIELIRTDHIASPGTNAVETLLHMTPAKVLQY